MKKQINRRVFDTETSQYLGTVSRGYFGDPAGYEESLFQTRTGQYFLYGKGGDSSPYPQEDILPMTKAQASKWTIEAKA